MKTAVVNWEDDDNNRHIQFSMEYSIENGQVELGRVTPKSVSFVCPSSGVPKRTIGVHTETGRQLISTKLVQSGHLAVVADQIAQESGLLAAV